MQFKEMSEHESYSTRDMLDSFMRSPCEKVEVFDDKQKYKNCQCMRHSLAAYIKRYQANYPNVKAVYQKGHCYLIKQSN